jgi:phosphoribosyl-ATP pyrophosphohydrolase/phosphoribosyl-AMP cyclohydrolase
MTINFEKFPDKLVPAIVQDADTRVVLMLGYMDQQAYRSTLDTKRVTFYSRSKQRLWTKGETSGNYLTLESIKADCDGDALLIKARPAGPVCHKGTDSCWGQDNVQDYGFLSTLEAIIDLRRKNPPAEGSYVSGLFEKGTSKIAQKVGEEAVEVVIEAMQNKQEDFINESADLLFHYLILLQSKGHRLNDIAAILAKRHGDRQ